MLYFEKDYIIVYPRYNRTNEHKHLMLHLLISTENIRAIVEDEEICGKLIIIGKEMRHQCSFQPEKTILLLIEPTSTLAKGLEQCYLKNEKYKVVDDSFMHEEVQQLVNDGVNREEALMALLRRLHLAIKREEEAYDKRILQILDQVRRREWLFLSIEELAERVHLSPSRLTHLFKEQVGVRLKSYLVMMRLSGAYELILQGKSYTQAAMELGFSDSAHLAATSQKLTGISIHTFFYGNKETD